MCRRAFCDRQDHVATLLLICWEEPAELRRFEAALAAEVHAETLLIEKLKMQLAILPRARIGRSSEKFDRDIEQLELLIGDMEESEADNQARLDTTEPSAQKSSQMKVLK
jgi:transposase